MKDLPKKFYSINHFEKTIVPNYYYDNIRDDEEVEETIPEETKKFFKIIDDLSDNIIF